MADLTFNRLADAPVLDEVPDGAKVYAEVDGKVYRVAGDNLGGGVPTAIFEMTYNASAEYTSLDGADKPVVTAAEGETTEATETEETAETEETSTVTENEATPPAVGIARSVATYDSSRDAWTGVCTNMTYAKAKAILEAGKPLMVVSMLTYPDYPQYNPIVSPSVSLYPDWDNDCICVDDSWTGDRFYWLPDDTVSNVTSSGGEA